MLKVNNKIEIEFWEIKLNKYINKNKIKYSLENEFIINSIKERIKNLKEM